MKQTIIALDRSHLVKIIKAEIAVHGNNCDLNHINVSGLKNFNYLFSDVRKFGFGLKDFNGDISQWDVFDAKTMNALFYGYSFNGDISNWNVEHVEDMRGMFIKSQFSGDLSSWRPYNLKEFGTMFKESPAPMPYWYFYSNKGQRAQAIDKYKRVIHLESQLPEKESHLHKVKL